MLNFKVPKVLDMKVMTKKGCTKLKYLHGCIQLDNEMLENNKFQARKIEEKKKMTIISGKKEALDTLTLFILS